MFLVTNVSVILNKKYLNHYVLMTYWFLIEIHFIHVPQLLILINFKKYLFFIIDPLRVSTPEFKIILQIRNSYPKYHFDRLFESFITILRLILYIQYCFLLKISIH